MKSNKLNLKTYVIKTIGKTYAVYLQQKRKRKKVLENSNCKTLVQKEHRKGFLKIFLFKIPIFYLIIYFLWDKRIVFASLSLFIICLIYGY